MSGLTKYLLVLISITTFASCLITDEEQAQDWLDWYNDRAQEVYNEKYLSTWDYYTNLTEYNQQRMIETSVRSSLFDKEAGLNATRFDWRNFENGAIRREFSKIAGIGTARLEEEEIVRYDTLRSDLLRIYSTGEVCLQPDNCLSLDPGLNRLLITSRDYEELQKIWVDWRDATGQHMRDMYTEYVELSNKAAKLNGYEDMGESRQAWYEMEDFEADILRLWQEVAPLYKQLHAYARRKLQAVYSDHAFPSSGHIPAHLFGNMWAQEWGGISDILLPYPNSSAADITRALIDQGYEALDIVELAENFFVSLGMEAMPESFWQNSMFVRPDDRDVVCHASAWDFYDGRDFRIKQCTDINVDFVLTTHHEMGHIQYALQYKDQPVKFRDGANPGFHEAVGDVMALSVTTPEHLHEIGLLDIVATTEESDLNFLMQQALQKVAFLPFGYMIDQWRWGVYSGDTPPSKYNEHWWKYRCQYQGISPPVTRSEDDFDPGAKYHIPKDTPYIRYFVSRILQFQLQQALCTTAGHTGPLHRCDIYNSRAAGQQLSDLLQLGSSVPWQDALRQAIGQDTLSADALLEYFQPLYDWLVQENDGHPIGWEEDCPAGLIIGSGSADIAAFSAIFVMFAVFTKEIFL